MAAVPWTFVLCDLAGNQLGEVMNADARQVIIPLKGAPTASFTIKTNNYLSPYLTDPNWDGLLKAYRASTLVFNGPVVSGQEQGSSDGSSVQVNAAGPFWRLNFRHLGTPISSGAQITPWVYGNATTTYDLGDIAANMLAAANLQGYTGIEWSTPVASSNGAAGPYILQPVGDALMNLSAGSNSFEFIVTPTEPTNVGKGWPQIGQMYIGPLIGQVSAYVVFEYGAGAANVQSYSNTVDRSGMMNQGYMLQPASTDNSDVLLKIDATSQAARGVFSGVVDSGSVEWDVYRQLLLDTNVIVRRQGRQVLNFVPHPSAVWKPFVDYNVGDQVRCRVTQDGAFRFDAMFRIWGIQFDIDATGNETPTLQLVPPTPSS